MPILHAPITRILSSPRQGMHLPEFYQQYQEQQQLPTQEYINSQIERLRNRAASPRLQPGARVQNINPAISQPENFQNFYRQLDTIRRMGQERSQAESVLAQLRARQPRSFGSVGSAALGKDRLAPYVSGAKNELGSLFGIRNIGGFATSGHIKNSDHYTGHALDFMTRNGQGLADYATSNAGRLGVKYVIWNRQIWQPGRGWGRYTGSSPHTDHVHVSFYQR